MSAMLLRYSACVPAISMLNTLVVEFLWTALTETAKYHIFTIDVAR